MLYKNISFTFIRVQVAVYEAMTFCLLRAHGGAPFHLPRPQASLLSRVRCALGYGIDSAQFARRCGIPPLTE